MSEFLRKQADVWHHAVPGARWFKADLHIHTIDDHPGRAKTPGAIKGDWTTEENVERYARLLLQAAAKRQVHVLGLTPHSARLGDNGDASAAWQIVEEWNHGVDDDGIPFHDKVYAVFPGFEPSLREGQGGVHVLFLFDPEIGRINYLRAFDLVMNQVKPWQKNRLQLSHKSPREAFQDLHDFHQDNQDGPNGSAAWNYIALAPHIDNEKGVFRAEKGQILEKFPFNEIAGLELGDEKLPDDLFSKRPWLPGHMKKLRHAFFHGSDAYSVKDIGRRFTWLKLAQPSIEGLRQAFLAADSRMRIAYERTDDRKLAEIPDAPDVTRSQRPWLKSIEIRGGASFFRREDGIPFRFELSPDLTCIIGGSMAGKSTLLDGLRVYVEAPLPDDSNLRNQVVARGRERFLAASPEIILECPGQDPTGHPHEYWPAVFYAQNELQRLAQDPNAIEDLLARLVEAETAAIKARQENLQTLDNDLARLAMRLRKLEDGIAETEQATERATRATNKLTAFSEAGINELHDASAAAQRWREALVFAEDAHKETEALADRVASNELLTDHDHPPAVADVVPARRRDTVRHSWRKVLDLLRGAADELAQVAAESSSAASTLAAHEAKVKAKVERELAQAGLDGAHIREFQALSQQAALRPSYQAHLDRQQEELAKKTSYFKQLLAERSKVVQEQRQAFDRVICSIQNDFHGRIRAIRIDEGSREPMHCFLRGLKQGGVTRWWNDLDEDQRPMAEELLASLQERRLADLGMSAAVAKTFGECMPVASQRDMQAIRCNDRYLLELEVSPGDYRRLDSLSGGQRVSVLLSLLLETNDPRPLVIDQPEDELDTRFLFDTVLPALKKLKGRRQIIVATHQANIVVNGDADQVILLEATADQGRIACAGAIESAFVRNAIVHTLDGGDEAFRLRQVKYGF